MTLVTDDAVQFDQLAAVARIMGGNFSVTHTDNGEPETGCNYQWTVTVDRFFASDHDTLAGAVTALVQQVLDAMWRQVNAANNAKVVADGRIKALRRIEYR